jgi:hypothetical protein
MPSDSLNIIKNHLETNIGDLGILIFEKSISTLNITVNPSKNDIENLIFSLENTVEKLYGSKKSRAIFENLRIELNECDRFFNKFFGSKIEDTLNNFFEMKGIPRETEIKELAGFLISNGYEQTEKKVIETLKKLTKERIIRDLKSSIINDEIKSFLDHSLIYSENDIEIFLKQVKAKQPDVNVIDLKDKIEKERLFRKFNYMERKENEAEKILKQYVALFNDSLKKEYKYIVSDKDIISLMKKNHYLYLYFKRYSIDQKPN